MDDVYKTQFIGYEVNSKNIDDVLKNIYLALDEKGYKPIDQIEGYILSGDPTYITSYKGARKDITRIERDDLIAFLLKYYFDDIFKK